jgi:hypothetical protein
VFFHLQQHTIHIDNGYILPCRQILAHDTPCRIIDMQDSDTIHNRTLQGKCSPDILPASAIEFRLIGNDRM